MELGRWAGQLYTSDPGPIPTNTKTEFRRHPSWSELALKRCRRKNDTLTRGHHFLELYNSLMNDDPSALLERWRSHV
jgi:hypothetical protein